MNEYKRDIDVKLWSLRFRSKGARACPNQNTEEDRGKYRWQIIIGVKNEDRAQSKSERGWRLVYLIESLCINIIYQNLHEQKTKTDRPTENH